MKKRLCSIATLVGALLFLGCGSDDGVFPADSPQQRPLLARAFVYTSVFGQCIDLYSVNTESGRPVVASRNAYTGLEAHIEADPGGRYLFADGLAGVQTFSVNPVNGLLSQTSLARSTPAPGHELVVNRQGTLLYRPGLVLVEAFSINRDNGSLTPAGNPVSASEPLFDGAVDANNRFVYFLGDQSIQRYSIGTNGALTLVGATVLPTVSSTQSLVIDDANQNLLVLDSGTLVAAAKRGKRDSVLARADGTNQILRFGIQPDGSLTEPTFTPIGSRPDEFYTDLKTRDNLVFVAEDNHSTTAVYTIGNGGTLTKVGTNTAGGGDELALVPSFSALVSSSFFDETVSAQLFSPAGVLTPAPGAPLAGAGEVDDITALVTYTQP